MYLPLWDNIILEEWPPPLPHRTTSRNLPAPHLDPGQSLCCPLVQSNTYTSLKVQFWNHLLEAFYKKTEVVFASINAPEISLCVLHGNHYQVQPFYSCEFVLSSLGLCHDLWNRQWLDSRTGLSLMIFIMYSFSKSLWSNLYAKPYSRIWRYCDEWHRISDFMELRL